MVLLEMAYQLTFGSAIPTQATSTISTGGLCSPTSPLIRLFYVYAATSRVTLAMTATSVGVGATRIVVFIVTIVASIIIVVLITAILATPKFLDGIGQFFGFFLEGIVDFLVMVDAGTRTFESKFNKILHAGFN